MIKDNNYTKLAHLWINVPYKDRMLLEVLANTGITLSKLTNEAHEIDASKEELEKITIDCSKVIQLMTFDVYRELNRLKNRASIRNLSDKEIETVKSLNDILGY